jgi:hypothetical protein
MSDYLEGHIKRDPATGSVAIRTYFNEGNPQLAGMAWLIATSNMGARHCRTADLADWEDLHSPPPPEPSDG